MRRVLALVVAAAVGAAITFALCRPNVAPGPPTAEAEPGRIPRLLDYLGPAPTKEEESASLLTGTGELVCLDRNGHLTRRTAAGQERWAVTLDGPTGGVRPPHCLADADRVYVTHGDGVTALNAADGAVRWHAPGPSDRLLLSGDLLLATECWSRPANEPRARWVVARLTTTGREAFRFPIPTDEFDPLPIEEAAGLFLVQRLDSPDGRGLAVLFDRTGAEHCRLDRRVVAVLSHAGGRLVLTGRDVVRLSANGRVEWSAPFRENEWFAGGGLVPLPGGGMIAFRCCQIADSGVQVLRFDPIRGGTAWEASCLGLGVEHSGYNHAADVEVVRDRLRVISRGGAGLFVEVLDLGTGRSLSRGDTLSRP